MTRWIRRRLRDWILDYNVESVEVCEERTNVVDTRNNLRFLVIPASGGTIVQMTYWDKNDNNQIENHVIPEGDNVADAIGKIVSLELLRR